MLIYDYTVVQLRKIAKQLGLKGYSKLKKTELYNLINLEHNQYKRHNMSEYIPIKYNGIDWSSKKEITKLLKKHITHLY